MWCSATEVFLVKYYSNLYKSENPIQLYFQPNHFKGQFEIFIKDIPIQVKKISQLTRETFSLSFFFLVIYLSSSFLAWRLSWFPLVCGSAILQRPPVSSPFFLEALVALCFSSVLVSQTPCVWNGSIESGFCMRLV